MPVNTDIVYIRLLLCLYGESTKEGKKRKFVKKFLATRLYLFMPIGRVTSNYPGLQVITQNCARISTVWCICNALVSHVTLCR